MRAASRSDDRHLEHWTWISTWNRFTAYGIISQHLRSTEAHLKVKHAEGQAGDEDTSRQKGIFHCHTIEESCTEGSTREQRSKQHIRQGNVSLGLAAGDRV